MKIGVIIFSGVLLSVNIIYAQTDFRPGYIIRTDGNIVSGTIDYRGDLMLGEVCRFRPPEDKNIIKYFPGEIIGYRFNDDRFYVSKEIKGKKVFLELLIKGEVSIYYLRDNGGDHYFIEKTGPGIAELPYEEIERGTWENGNSPYLYKPNKHIGVLNYYMQDVPEFQSRIAAIGKPNHENLIRLAEDYQARVNKNEACIIYTNKQPLIKLKIGIAGGILNYQSLEFQKDRNYFQTGIIARFWLPHINEKLYLRTGIMYSTIEYDDATEPIYMIPIIIEYTSQKGTVRPMLGYGIDIINNKNFGPYDVSVTGGVEIIVSKTVSVTVTYTLGCAPNEKVILLPGKMVYQSVLAGVQFKL